MNKSKVQRAIKTLRDSGMTDSAIEAELGFSLTDIMGAERRGSLNGEIIDAEIVEVDNLPAVIERSTYGEAEGMEKPFHASRPGRDEKNRSTVKENVIRWDSHLDTNAERRCTATNSKGERCRRYAIPGGRVCPTHGGKSRHVVNKARIRVEMASNRLMGKLIEFAFDDTRPAAVQLDAIKDSLNRAGLKPPTEIAIGTGKPYEEIFDDIATTTREDSRRARGYEEPQNLAEELLGSSVEFIGPQHVSSTETPYHPAPASGPQGTDDQQPSEGDSDPLTATDSHQDQRPDGRHRTRVVEGYDALHVANLANLGIRALPPGRGR